MANGEDMRVPTYRMKQLCERTGLSRQTIHFYIKKGVVPPGVKKAKTSAVYTEEHLERILLVRRMREEQFLPLDVIRATLSSRDEGFSPAQRQMIEEVRKKYATPKASKRQRPSLAVSTVSKRTGVTVVDIEELVSQKLVRGHCNSKGETRIDRDDLWVIECWGELERLGIRRDRGFLPAHLGIYKASMEKLVEIEAALITTVLAEQSADEVSSLIERLLPSIAKVLAGFHAYAVDEFLEEADQSKD